ncbi:MAG TPA: hypothetical protein VIO60_02560 [Rectinemataceae bacterium]
MPPRKRIAADGSPGSEPDPAQPEPRLVAETAGINLYSEYSLHDALKRLAAGSGGRIEATIEGRVADALTADGEIVEIQTARLGSLQDKVEFWTGRGYRVRVQYPLAAHTTIVKVSQKTGEALSERASPRHKQLWDAFGELVRAPGMLSTPGLVFEILFVKIREFRIQLETPERRGRFMRGTRTEDRVLESVLASKRFSSSLDWLELLAPHEGAEPRYPLSAASLAESLGIGVGVARKVVYSYARAGLLEPYGKLGRTRLYELPGIGMDSSR